MPETSLVIRTFNEAKHIGNLLSALEKQTYRNFEVVIVDSGSTDGTVEIAKKFATHIVPIESRDFTFGYSLNVGCRAARGKYLVFASAHVLPVHEGWLAEMVAPFTDEKIAMVYGSQRAAPQTKFSERRDFLRLFGKLALNSNVPIYYANNANSAIRKSLWEERNFDEYLFGLEDIDFARAMIERGFSIYYAPKAGIHHIHEESWPQVFNRYRREAIAAVRIGMPYPPQARLSIGWFIWRIIDDLRYSFPNFLPSRIEEILRFRYYQWTGSRQGWYQDRGLDVDRNKFELFFPNANRALVTDESGISRVVELPLPSMKPGDILVKVLYVGIEADDFSLMSGVHVHDVSVRTPGKTFFGKIVKIGANNSYRERFVAGDVVKGRSVESAFREYLVVPGDTIFKVENTLFERS